MNQHRLPQPGENTRRWQITPPGETVVLRPGCYVEGVNITAAGCRNIAAIAYGMGALDQQGYSDMVRAIDTAAEETEVFDAIQHELVATLNAAAIDGVWGFIDGDLMYEPAEWEGWES